MKIFHKLLLSLLFVCLSLSAQKVELGTEMKQDAILVSVNGESITLLDVLLESGPAEAKLTAMHTGERLYSSIEDLRKKCVDSIIIRKLVYALYQREPFDIPRQHVEDAVDMIAQTMGDGTREALVRRIKSYGITLTDFREKAKEKIAVEILLRKNCDHRVTITPKEVYEYYQNHPEKWTSPPRIEIQLLQVLKEKVEGGADPVKVMENLKEMLKDADADRFTRIVRENSSGPNAATGGNMGWIDMDKLRPEFSDALKDAKIGMIAGPVDTPEAFYFIRVKDLSPEKKVPFEEVSVEITDELRKDAVEKRRRTWTDSLKDEAVIRYYF